MGKNTLDLTEIQQEIFRAGFLCRLMDTCGKGELGKFMISPSRDRRLYVGPGKTPILSVLDTTLPGNPRIGAYQSKPAEPAQLKKLYEDSCKIGNRFVGLVSVKLNQRYSADCARPTLTPAEQMEMLEKAASRHKKSLGIIKAALAEQGLTAMLGQMHRAIIDINDFELRDPPGTQETVPSYSKLHPTGRNNSETKGGGWTPYVSTLAPVQTK